jgi:hypothetical protein
MRMTALVLALVTLAGCSKYFEKAKEEEARRAEAGAGSASAAPASSAPKPY